MSQITSKTEIMDEIIVVQNRLDKLSCDDENESLFDRLSSKKEKLCDKLKPLCNVQEYDQFILSL